MEKAQGQQKSRTGSGKMLLNLRRRQAQLLKLILKLMQLQQMLKLMRKLKPMQVWMR